MPTEALIERLLLGSEGEPTAAVVAALHALLDDGAVEASAEPRGVAEAAALVGLSPHTLRYYENEGLVAPARTTAGHRAYSPSDLRRLVFLTRMRLSGMTMKDLRRYIALVDGGDATVPERRRIMCAQRDRIRRQLRELTLALEATEYKIRTYGGHPEG